MGRVWVVEAKQDTSARKSHYIAVVIADDADSAMELAASHTPQNLRVKLVTKVLFNAEAVDNTLLGVFAPGS
jgi:hypothetical protein